MGIINNLMAAVKGHVTGAGEVIQDANVMTILKQQVREAENAIVKAKSEKSIMTARRKLKKKAVDELNTKIDERTKTAKEAKAQNNMGVARELAENVMKLTEMRDYEMKLFDQYKGTEDRMEASIRQSKGHLDGLKRRIESAKANQAIINAQRAASVNSTASGSKLSNAVDSLARLEERQAEQRAMLDAAEEEAKIELGSDLEAKIAQFKNPSKSSADDFLASL